MSTSELACVYASLILVDDGLEVSADNINKIAAAAGVTVEAYWPTLFAKFAAKKNIGELIENVGAGGGGGAAAAAAAAPAAAAAAAAPPPPEEESDQDMGFSLFD
eukprot:gene23014-30207_t